MVNFELKMWKFFFDLVFQDLFYRDGLQVYTIHNLDLNDCKNALKEIQRVSKKDAFITVDAYNNADEKNKMFEWNLTAKTILSVKEWKELFNETGYTGDYFWFIP